MTFVAVAVSDIHFPLHNKKVWGAFESAVDDLRPDVLVFVGDILDNQALSRYPDAEGSEYRLEDEALCAVQHMNRVIAKAKRALILEGNHDERLRKFLGLHRRAVKNVDVFKLKNVMKHYGLLQSGVEWVDQKTMGVVLGTKNPVLFRHGHKSLSSGAAGGGGLTRANKLLRRYPEVSQVVGHHHLAALAFNTGYDRNTFAMVLPCMQDIQEYDPEANWQHGFGLVVWHGGKSLDTSPHVSPGLVVASAGGALSWGRHIWTGKG